MHNPTIIIDLANDVFELGIVGQSGKITQRHRLRRADFARFMSSDTGRRTDLSRTLCAVVRHTALQPGHGRRRLVSVALVSFAQRLRPGPARGCDASVRVRLADELALEGLVEFIDKPRHRRSKLVRLTPRGDTSYRAIEARFLSIASNIGLALSVHCRPSFDRWSRRRSRPTVVGWYFDAQEEHSEHTADRWNAS